MARYVLLEFEDNEQADMFVKMFDRSNFINDDHPPAGVVGVFFKPTQFCECPDPGDKQARGQKWNLWIHRGCGKPLRGHTQHPRNLLITEDQWAKLTPREKAAFYLGIQEGIPLPWLGRE